MGLDIASSIWPGGDASGSTSSAKQLRELLPRMEYWDLHPSQQTHQNMLERILSFKTIMEFDGLPPSRRSPARKHRPKQSLSPVDRLCSRPHESAGACTHRCRVSLRMR